MYFLYLQFFTSRHPMWHGAVINRSRTHTFKLDLNFNNETSSSGSKKNVHQRDFSSAPTMLSGHHSNRWYRKLPTGCLMFWTSDMDKISCCGFFINKYAPVFYKSLSISPPIWIPYIMKIVKVINIWPQPEVSSDSLRSQIVVTLYLKIGPGYLSSSLTCPYTQYGSSYSNGSKYIVHQR